VDDPTLMQVCQPAHHLEHESVDVSEPPNFHSSCKDLAQIPSLFLKHDPDCLKRRRVGRSEGTPTLNDARVLTLPQDANLSQGSLRILSSAQGLAYALDSYCSVIVGQRIRATVHHSVRAMANGLVQQKALANRRWCMIRKMQTSCLAL